MPFVPENNTLNQKLQVNGAGENDLKFEFPTFSARSRPGQILWNRKEQLSYPTPQNRKSTEPTTVSSAMMNVAREAITLFMTYWFRSHTFQREGSHLCLQHHPGCA